MFNHNSTLTDYISRITNNITIFKSLIDDVNFTTTAEKKSYLNTILRSLEELKLSIAFQPNDFFNNTKGDNHA